MRKRTFLSIFDNLFWFLLGFYPLIFGFIYFINEVKLGETITTTVFIDYVMYFISPSNNFIVDNFFCSNFMMPLLNFVNGIFNLGDGNVLLVVIPHFITVQLLHLLVDVLLFIPRLCQKFVEVRA